jgi:beta-phosphoglucomutase-like phosphatase (HAD superfamily)
MALANKKQVEEMADKLTESADSIHERLMKAIRDKEIDQPNAQSIFQDEAILRQRANGLYIDAANSVITDLKQSQTSVIALVDTANKKIKRIRDITKFIDLIADLLVLASAVYAAKPSPIITALQEVKSDIEAIGGE